MMNDSDTYFEIIRQGLVKRHKKERRFRMMGFIGLATASIVLFVLIASIFMLGKSAFLGHYIKLPITLDASYVDPQGNSTLESINNGDFGGLIKKSLRDFVPNVTSRRDKKDLYKLISPEAALDLRDYVLDNPNLIGTTQDIWLLSSDEIDLYKKKVIGFGDNSIVSEKMALYSDYFKKRSRIKEEIYWGFFTGGDSRNAEVAGILGGLIGTFWLMLVTFFVSFPLGIMTAIYLEEFAEPYRGFKAKRYFLNFLEVNINSLASVPSIVFGILGLGIFINLFHFPRSAPLTGGFVLALMTLPVIIITARTSLRSVPMSIREAALGMGANKFQLVLHHVLPLALPGILTGSIIGLSRAIGETAPLLMIGMVAFIIGSPDSVLSPSTALPVQIYLWADSADQAFIYKTAAAILVLLVFMILMNLSAIIIRQKFARKW